MHLIQASVGYRVQVLSNVGVQEEITLSCSITDRSHTRALKHMEILS